MNLEQRIKKEKIVNLYFRKHDGCLVLGTFYPGNFTIIKAKELIRINMIVGKEKSE